MNIFSMIIVNFLNLGIISVYFNLIQRYIWIFMTDDPYKNSLIFVQNEVIYEYKNSINFM